MPSKARTGAGGGGGETLLCHPGSELLLTYDRREREKAGEDRKVEEQTKRSILM